MSRARRSSFTATISSSSRDVNWEVRRWTAARCPEIADLEAAATTEGHSFVERTRHEWEAGINRFDESGEVFFVAVDRGRTVGMCGLNRDPYLDDSSVGRLRHLYIGPTHRRSGIAECLVERCLSSAAESFKCVRLRTSNPAADALYRSLGFEAVSDPTATHEWRP